MDFYFKFNSELAYIEEFFYHLFIAPINYLNYISLYFSRYFIISTSNDPNKQLKVFYINLLKILFSISFIYLLFCHSILIKRFNSGI